MKQRLDRQWAAARDSFWFVPAVMTLAAAALSFATVAIDERVTFDFAANRSWGYAGGPDGARALLATIAGSMITVAGVSFSITIAALALSSSQYGPRLLRNFIRDIGNQVVLGTFLATFMYCLLVLRAVRGPGGDDFVPYVSIGVGILLAVASIALLIYFIHHISHSIQATHVIASVGRDLDRAIQRLFPQEAGRGIPAEEEREFQPPEGGQALVSPRSGYVQAIDLTRIMRIAQERGLLIRIEHHPGGFVPRGGRLVTVWDGAAIEPDDLAAITGAFTIGDRRTPAQDVEFSIDQLVEIAVRALSPGVNDPFTAMACIDRLGVGLRQLAEKQFPSPFRYDEDGHLRVIARPVRFAGIADAAFNQIRQYGHTSAAVSMRLMETIAIIAEHTSDPDQREVLLRHAMMIERGSREGLSEQLDWKDIDARYREVIEALTDARRAAAPPASS